LVENFRIKKVIKDYLLFGIGRKPMPTIYNPVYYKEYYKKNREKILKRKREKYKDRPEYRKQYYLEHREEIKQKARNRRIKIKLKVLQHYSQSPYPFCSCCNEKHWEFLEIDHINNDGAKHRKELGLNKGGTQFFRWLIKNNFPEGFQVLCRNCNWAKYRYGKCPHK